MWGCLGLDPSPSPTAESPAPVASTGTSASPGTSPASSLAPSPAATGPITSKPAPCPGTDRTPGAAAGRRVTGSSSNWSGYVAAVRKTGVTCVEASWIEPSVTCSHTGHQAVAIWIGIDGFSSSLLGIPKTNILIQVGTQADCNSGTATHRFWHEVLPADPTEVTDPGPVHAGDHISARILYAGGTYTMAIHDAETDWTWTTVATAPGAPRKTAEWIVEAPASNCPGSCAPVALPKFTAVTFTNAHATIAGQRSSINDDSWTHVKLRMSRNGIVRTSTSSLSSHGTTFKVTFVHR